MTRQEFPAKVKAEAFRLCGGHCQKCTRKLATADIFFDHIVPDALGGEPILSNCQTLCGSCHSLKTAGQDVPAISKAKRREARHIGAKTPSRRPMPCGKHSPWKRTMDGRTVRR